jgi:hypothetical protein
VSETDPTVMTADALVPFAVAVIVTGVADAVAVVFSANFTLTKPLRTVTDGFRIDTTAGFDDVSVTGTLAGAEVLRKT